MRTVDEPVDGSAKHIKAATLELGADSGEQRVAGPDSILAGVALLR